MFALWRQILASPRVTREGVPAPPAGSCGMPLPVPGKCDGCGECVSVCPSRCITAEKGRTARIDWGACVQCGRCIEACPAGAIDVVRTHETAAFRREDLIVGEVPPAAWSAPRLSEKIRSLLGRSLQIRHVDSGSCNGCDWEMTALLNPVYDVQRLGIDFVASPRHADLLMVTGTVSENLRKALRDTVEAAPEPRVVVATGACAISGACWGDAPESLGGVDRVVKVDVYIPGCPPRPDAMIFGLLVAMGRMEARRAGG